MSCANNACKTRAAAAARLGAPQASGAAAPVALQMLTSPGDVERSGNFRVYRGYGNRRRSQNRVLFYITNPSAEIAEHFKARGFRYSSDEGCFSAPLTYERQEFVKQAKVARDVADLGPLPDEYVAKKQAAALKRIARKTMGAMDKLASKTNDPNLLSSDHLADLYSRLATGLVGKPRRVTLRVPQEGESRFGTNMAGKIWAHPYPLGQDAPARKNMIVTRAGIEHELGHELYTPMSVCAAVRAVAEGTEPIEGISRELIRRAFPLFFNVVEDGRMERELVSHNAGVAAGLAASCRLEPRWPGPCGRGDAAGVAQDVMGALLYTGLPYFEVTPEQEEGLSDRALEIYQDLRPVVAAAVNGTGEDAFAAAIEIARRFEAEQLFSVPQVGSPPPAPPKDTQKWQPPTSITRQPAPSTGSKPGQAKCPHCGGFLDAQGKCNNPDCPGPDAQQQAAPSQKEHGTPKPAAQKESKAGQPKQDQPAEANKPQPAAHKPSKPGQPKSSESDEDADANADDNADADDAEAQRADKPAAQKESKPGQPQPSESDADDDADADDAEAQRADKPATHKPSKSGQPKPGESDEDADADADDADDAEAQRADKPAAHKPSKPPLNTGGKPGQPQPSEPDEGADADADDDADDAEAQRADKPAAHKPSKPGQPQPSEPDAQKPSQQGEGDEGEDGESGESSGASSSAGKSAAQKPGQASQSQQGQGEDAEGDESSESSADAVAGYSAGEAGGESSSAGNSRASMSAPKGRTPNSPPPQFSDEELEAAMSGFEEEAALVATAGIQRDNSFEVLGQALHAPLRKQDTTDVKQIARDPVSGLPQPVNVSRWRKPEYQAAALPYHTRVKPVANRLAIELDDIRSAVRQRRDRYQDEGRFDRTRLVAAFKGDKTYRYKDVKEDDTSLSASLVVDLSGSMGDSVKNGDLYTAVATVSQAMTQLDMPHEVRAFSNHSLQLKAMDDPQLDDERVGLLASDSLGSTWMHETTLLAATALMGREERNKLGLFLTDGELHDHKETQATLEAMRKKGVITFGVFYGNPDTHTVQRLDELYGATRGKRNWVAISNLSEYPKKVGRRIAELFNELD